MTIDATVTQRNNNHSVKLASAVQDETRSRLADCRGHIAMGVSDSAGLITPSMRHDSYARENIRRMGAANRLSGESGSLLRRARLLRSRTFGLRT